MRGFLFGVIFSTLIFSCASGTTWSPGNVEQLTLLMGQAKAELFYPYCGKYKYFSGKCKDKRRKSYDLTDPVVRKELKNFTCKHESRDW